MKEIKDELKSNETEKIVNEILNEINVIDALEKQYYLGVAKCLSILTDIANNYVNNNADELNAHLLIEIISELKKQNIKLEEYYNRLNKDKKINIALLKTGIELSEW